MPIIRINDLKQGSDEWFAARMAIATGSGFSRIITPSGKPSSQQDDYMDKLVAEWSTGKVDETFKSDWMKRGHEMEPPAADLFSFENDVVVETVGIVYKNEDRLVACSPDRLYQQDGKLKGLEIKAPKASTFVKYAREGILPSEYKAQVFGSMSVCDVEDWAFMSYHPDYKPFILHVEPDLVFMRTFEAILDSFINRMLERRESIKKYILE